MFLRENQACQVKVCAEYDTFFYDGPPFAW